MRRRVVHGAASWRGGLAAVASAPTGAEETGISGQVQSTIELSLQPPASGRVQATVTATVGGTRLSVSEPGRARGCCAPFGTRSSAASVRAHDRSVAGVTEQTITFGPQGP